MKLGRIVREDLDGTVHRLVAVEPDADRVIDLRAAHRVHLERKGATPSAARRISAAWFPGSMATAIAAGRGLVELAAEVVAAAGDDATHELAAVTWGAPIDPPVLRDCLVFEQHLRTQFGRADIPVPKQYYRAPVYYKANPTTVVGTDAEIPWPFDSSYMDYELELGFVLGEPALDVTPDEAVRHLFGVTVLNDFSTRDVQSREMSARLGPAKGKDFATALGPWITTADEVDVTALQMLARVNGEQWSKGTSADMMWSPAEIIAYVSQSERTVPGEVIGSGTVGSGSGSDLGRRLSPGDTVELEIEGIGTLRNTLASPGAVRWWPEPKPRPAGDGDG